MILFGTKILTAAQMRAIESAAMDSGEVTGLQLMERAGAAVVGQIRLHWPKPGRATVLCGPGNNGGDGYVIARLLAQAGWRVRVLGLDNTPGADAAEMRRRWLEIGPILPLTQTELRRRGESSDVYVDAIFGTGLTRPPEGELAEIISYLGGSGGDWGFFGQRLVAVDCPSGLCLDSGAFLGNTREPGEFDPHARMTIAFDRPKPGHLLDRGPECCGKLVIADIGLSKWREVRPSTIAIWPRIDLAGQRDTAPDHLRRLLGKASFGRAHKYSHGHALILAGGAGHGGAARLSARAALRVGAGLVTICPPAPAMAEHAGPPDALMRRPIDDAASLHAMLADQRINALCLGPGAGIDRAAGLLSSLLSSRRRCVLDADALTALARTPDLMGALYPNCILTPHMGEFARLFPDLAEKLTAPPLRGPAYSKLDAARDAATRSNATVLLKGPDTVIAAPDGRAIIHSAFDVPWLATAGSGDVLAGLITGLLARGLQPLDAAATGTWLHAAAARRFGPGLIADDLPEEIPSLFRSLFRDLGL